MQRRRYCLKFHFESNVFSSEKEIEYIILFFKKIQKDTL